MKRELTDLFDSPTPQELRRWASEENGAASFHKFQYEESNLDSSELKTEARMYRKARIYAWLLERADELERKGGEAR